MHHFSCCYCQSNVFVTIEKNAFHKTKKDHGPFSIYRCVSCDALITFPMPTEQQLHGLYATFKNGVDPRLTGMRTETPLTQWYKNCVQESASSLAGDFKWLDAGSGSGELASVMSSMFPASNGVVADLSPSAQNVSNVRAIAVDMNQKNWTVALPYQNFNLIICIAVLEHMMHPDKFLLDLTGLLARGGRLYLVTPDNSSWAAKFFRRKWPYYLPGEHLTIATPRGLSKWFQTLQQRSSSSFKARVSRSRIIYPVRYILNYYRLGAIARIFSKQTNIKVNAGLLKLIIERKK